MKDYRINISGTKLDNTCENSRFKTDINKGFEHFVGQGHKGSVTASPLYEDSGYSLFLEYVNDKTTGKNVLWFMWYNGTQPTISMSGVIDETDIAEVLRNITQIKF